MKVAIVCDWLVGGGAERVVASLHDIYPKAPIYTSYCSSEWRQQLGPSLVKTGYLQYWPFSKLRKFIPLLRVWWFTYLNLQRYDVLISVSAAEAKGIKRLNAKALHINYCNAPTHYYWDRYEQYLKAPGFGPLDGLARLGLRLLVGPMRKWDKRAARRPHVMIANSTYTQSKIKQYYGRDATVIHPPVDVDRFSHMAKDTERHGFITAGRQTPYKRIDLAVQACSQLGAPLTVIGNGPDHKRLTGMAGLNVTFLTSVSDTELPTHFAAAEAFIFPNADDFGIVAVEAMAAGTPVIAYKDGGALDYVIPGKTGEFFNSQTADGLADAIKNFERKKFAAKNLKAFAQNFSQDNFQHKVQDYLNKLISERIVQ